MQLLKTSISRARYWELPPGTVDRLWGSYFGSYNSGSRQALAASGAALGSWTKHIQTQDAKKTVLNMSGSGTATPPPPPPPGAPSWSATRWRLQVSPFGSLEPFLEAVSHDYIKRTRTSYEHSQIRSHTQIHQDTPVYRAAREHDFPFTAWETGWTIRWMWIVLKWARANFVPTWRSKASGACQGVGCSWLQA